LDKNEKISTAILDVREKAEIEHCSINDLIDVPASVDYSEFSVNDLLEIQNVQNIVQRAKIDKH
jgi:hypothetical protein